jgi:hypothetical protein
MLWTTDVIEERPSGAPLMLNLEYARVVEQERRRTIAERIRIERALHPEDTVGESRPVSAGRPGNAISPVRSVSTPAR